MSKWPYLVILLFSLEIRAEWKTLFYSPAQRAAMDRPASMPEQTYRFDGELRSSKGSTIRWVNGTAQTRQDLPLGIRPGDRWTVQAGTSGQTDR